MDPKITQFLRERDRARARQDWGVVRSLTADLTRWGVPDDATLTHPAGLPRQTRRKGPAVAVAEREGKQTAASRSRPPRCEHDRVAERCAECNPDLLAS